MDGWLASSGAHARLLLLIVDSESPKMKDKSLLLVELNYLKPFCMVMPGA